MKGMIPNKGKHLIRDGRYKGCHFRWKRIKTWNDVQYRLEFIQKDGIARDEQWMTKSTPDVISAFSLFIAGDHEYSDLTVGEFIEKVVS